jgi:GT2 family glycosyltransferase
VIYSAIVIPKFVILTLIDSTTNKMMQIAIVILNYNGKKHLAQFLPSVTQHLAANCELIIADNASTDDSLLFLNQHYPSLRLIPLEKNYGFAEGYNQALKQIKSDIYILLNSDVEVTNGWIEALVAPLQQDATIAAIQPKILSYTNKNHFEHAGAAGGWIDTLAYPFCKGRLFNDVEEDKGQYDTQSEIFWASGAAMCIRAELFHNFGGFDGDYFAHMEEIDLCWRLKRAGYKIMAAPQSIVYHLGGGTLDYSSPFKVYLNFRNSLSTILKNAATKDLVWIIFLRLCLDGIAGIFYLSKRQYQMTLMIIKAHFAFYARFRANLTKRKSYQKRIEKYRIGKENKNGIIYKSIVFQYFIKKRKTFSEL